MDIKLKKSDDRKRTEFHIFLLMVMVVFLFSAAYITNRAAHKVYWEYEEILNLVSLLCSSISCLMLSADLVLLYFYFTKYPDTGPYQQQGLGRIKIEGLAVIMMILAGGWMAVIHSGNHVNTMVMYSLLTLPLGMLFSGCVILGIRKIKYDTAAEASLLVKWNQKRQRNRSNHDSSFIDRDVKKKTELFFMAELFICIAGIVWLVVDYYQNGVYQNGVYIFNNLELEYWYLQIFSVIIVMGIVIAHYFYQQSSQRETGLLLRQIQIMSEGDFQTSFKVNEDSVMYQSYQQLLLIRSNLKTVLEQQLVDEKMKIDLITNMSHDLKTPLTSMVGYLDLLKKEELTPEAQDYLAILAEKQEHLKEMIEELFELSKVTSGSEQFLEEQLDMNKLLEQILTDMEEAFTENNLVLKKTFTESEAKLVGDGKKLYRVFQNLFENAVKYSLTGTRVFVETENTKGRMQVRVMNTASYEIDFTEAEITERFTRGDQARNTEGHGLGLAIAKSYIQAMGGEMKIEIAGDQFRVILEL